MRYSPIKLPVQLSHQIRQIGPLLLMPVRQCDLQRKPHFHD